MRIYNPGPERTRPWNGGEAVVPSGISEQPDDVGSIIVREFRPLGVAQLGLHVEKDADGKPVIDDSATIAQSDAFYRDRYGVEKTPGELARVPAAAPAPEAAVAPAEPAKGDEPEGEPASEGEPAKTDAPQGDAVAPDAGKGAE